MGRISVGPMRSAVSIGALIVVGRTVSVVVIVLVLVILVGLSVAWLMARLMAVAIVVVVGTGISSHLQERYLCPR